jgi:hypothetical protein
MTDDRATNRVHTNQRTPLPDGAIRKQLASTVPYGENIARRGGSVWVAYVGEQVVGVAATADEARRMYRAAKAAEDRARVEHKKRSFLDPLK